METECHPGSCLECSRGFVKAANVRQSLWGGVNGIHDLQVDETGLEKTEHVTKELSFLFSDLSRALYRLYSIGSERARLSC